MNEGLSEQELTFISNAEDPSLARACVAFATTCNHLDPSIIEGLLARNVHYGSQKVIEELHGKAEVFDYFSDKLETIRKGGLKRRVRAELAFDPLNHNPCVLIYQRASVYETGLGQISAYVELETDSAGLISSIFFVAIDPMSCQRTGIFPGLTTEQIARDWKTPGHPLPRGAQVTLKLFVISGFEANAIMERSVKALCQKHPGWKAEVIEDDPQSQFKGDAATYEIIGFPTLVIECDGEECLRLLGHQQQATIEKRIDQLLNF